MNFSFANFLIGGFFLGMGYLVLLKADVINNQFMPFTIGPKDIQGVLGYKLTGILLMLISIFVIFGFLNIGAQFESKPQTTQTSTSSSKSIFPVEKNNGIAQ